MNYKEKLLFIIKHYGTRKQFTKLFEEMGEVMIEISKFMLGNGNRADLGSKIADVMVMMDQLICQFGMEDYVLAQKQYKVDRQIKRIREGNKNEQ